MKTKTFLFFAASSALLFAHPSVAQTTTNDDVLINGDDETVNLEVTGDNGILFGGTFGSGYIPGADVLGTRMVWIPRKAAFRAGRDDYDYWNNSTVGNYSAAFGNYSKASGEGSFAVGSGQAIGDGSTALGNSYAGGIRSFALGTALFIDEDSGESIAMGTEALIEDSQGCFAYSYHYGAATMSSSINSCAIGGGNLTNTIGSISIGGGYNAISNTITGGSYCVGIGYENEMDGVAYGTAIGTDLIVHDAASTVLGFYNFEDYAGLSSNFQGQDKLLVVGNGFNEARSNALELRKNAELRVGGPGHFKGGLRASPLGDISMGAFTAGDNPASLDLGLEYDGE